MNRLHSILLISLVTVFLLSSCGEGEDPNPENLITILGKWTFTETTYEIISLDEGVEIHFPDSDARSGLEWVFLENDSLYVSDTDTSFVAYYHYDLPNKRLDINDGFYDVMSHTRDSLNIRFYSEIPVGEFYTHFQLIR